MGINCRSDERFSRNKTPRCPQRGHNPWCIAWQTSLRSLVMASRELSWTLLVCPITCWIILCDLILWWNAILNLWYMKTSLIIALHVNAVSFITGSGLASLGIVLLPSYKSGSYDMLLNIHKYIHITSHRNITIYCVAKLGRSNTN